jgi:hypothetical protein
VKTYDVGDKGSKIGLSNKTSYAVSDLLDWADMAKEDGTFDPKAFEDVFKSLNSTGKA